MVRTGENPKQEEIMRQLTKIHTEYELVVINKKILGAKFPIMGAKFPII